MMRIPLSAVPRQKLSIILDNQHCVLQVYQLGAALYMDLLVNHAQVFSGAICHNRVNVKAHDYLPFKGGLYFVDMEGSRPPHYSGFASRWQLLFVPAGQAVPAGLRP